MRKKRKHCDDDVPEDSRQGDNWDHVAYDPEHRLVVTVVPGKRTAKNVKKLVFDFKKRTDGRRLDRSYLVFARMADLSGCSIDIRHEEIFQFLIFLHWRSYFFAALIFHPELTRRYSHKLLKSSCKIALIIIADLEANLCAVLVGCQQ